MMGIYYLSLIKGYGAFMTYDTFQPYIKHTEADKREKGYAWYTAIGLQDVDGLKPSPYLLELAKKNIEGDISLEEVESLIKSYYENRPNVEPGNRTKEADNVSVKISQLIQAPGFTFSPVQYLAIHKELFAGIYTYAGQIRDYNISKKEWVLGGESIIYGSATELMDTLEYDLNQERQFSYKGLTQDQIIQHLATFVSRLWQIHVFAEGNTRTTAVFFIKYLRTLGYMVTNDSFAKHAWYFRNALVRANYTNLSKNIHETTEYVKLFLRNLLLGESHELRNRDLHIDA